eukprot:11220296-Lingulodinium_polyedra.AAC.1
MAPRRPAAARGRCDKGFPYEQLGAAGPPRSNQAAPGSKGGSAPRQGDAPGRHRHAAVAPRPVADSGTPPGGQRVAPRPPAPLAPRAGVCVGGDAAGLRGAVRDTPGVGRPAAAPDRRPGGGRRGARG